MPSDGLGQGSAPSAPANERWPSSLTTATVRPTAAKTVPTFHLMISAFMASIPVRRSAISPRSTAAVLPISLRSAAPTVAISAFEADSDAATSALVTS